MDMIEPKRDSMVPISLFINFTIHFKSHAPPGSMWLWIKFRVFTPVYILFHLVAKETDGSVPTWLPLQRLSTI